jgi:vacuolar-type H+-ATPase subunit F/Vma7
MIVLGNPEFALGMKFAGVNKSYAVKSREEGIELLKEITKEDFIIANQSIVEMIFELKEMQNVVVVPDHAKDFGKIDDLKDIIKSVVGIELEV